MIALFKKIITKFQATPTKLQSDIIKSYSYSDGKLDYMTFKKLEDLGRLLHEKTITKNNPKN